MHFLRAAKPVLIDLASTLVFLAAYETTRSIRFAVISGIAFGMMQLTWSLVRKVPVPPMQWASLGLILVMGGASLWTQNPRFLMFKPTIIYAVLAVVMAQPGWLARYLPEIVTGNVAPSVIAAWAKAWPALMVALGAANIGVALYLSFDFWTWYSSFAPVVAVAALFVVQYAVFSRLIAQKLRVERVAAG
jgi:intracellular septation protein